MKDVQTNLKLNIKQKRITVSRILPTAALLGAVLLWGSSFSAMRMVLNDLNPMAAMFLRLFIGSVCLLPFMGKLVPKNYQKGDWKILLAMVACQPCLYFLFESQALIYTTSSQAGIISACLPLLVAAAAFIFLSEPIKPRTIVGLLLSIFGVVLLTLFQARNATAPNPILGNSLEIAAMIAACGYTIIVKKLTQRYNPWTLTGMQLMAGTLFFSTGLEIYSGSRSSHLGYKACQSAFISWCFCLADSLWSVQLRYQQNSCIPRIYLYQSYPSNCSNPGLDFFRRNPEH